MTTEQKLREALEANGCERLRDFYNVGPVQRAAVESFVAALSLPEQQAVDAALMANRADDELRRAEHYKERALRAEKQLTEQQAPQGEWVCVAPPRKCDSSNFNRCCFSSTAALEAATGGMNFHDVLAADLGVIQREPEAAKTETEREELTTRHEANEWADVATNGLQWLRNVRDGISTVEDAIENMEVDLAHCRKTADMTRAALLAADSKAGGEPVLARDLAAIIDRNVPEVSAAITDLGFGNRSTNMALHPDEAVAVAKHFASKSAGMVFYVDPVGLAALNTDEKASVVLFRNPTGYAERPLYTRPQQQAKPLTKEQIAACASNLADTILFDLQDRKGLLDGVDEDTLQEMVAAHTSIIIDGLAVHGIGDQA